MPNGDFSMRSGPVSASSSHNVGIEEVQSMGNNGARMRALVVCLCIESLCVAQTRTWKLMGGPPGGSIRCLGVDSSGSLLVGTQSGQILRSSDSGNSCQQIISHPIGVVAAIAVTPPGGVLVG